MKIVVVVPYLKSFGGASRYAWELSEYLATQGDDVIITSLYTDKTAYSSDTKLKIIDFGDEKNLTQSLNFWINLKKNTNSLKEISFLAYVPRIELINKLKFNFITFFE